MREIEIKFKVDNLEKLIKKLQSMHCKISSINYQHDTIYVKDLNNVESIEGSVWLRVRRTNEKIELNYKKQSAIKMESKEIEFEVSSYEKANEFLKALGLKEWVQVNKKRRYSKYKQCNICIDEVERLGNFVELEVLIDEENNYDYEKLLLDIAIELGIDTSKRINSHYDTMISQLEE